MFGLDLALLGWVGRESPRRATYFSLLRQRNLRKRKATRSLGPCAALRATCAAPKKRGSSSNSLRSDNRSPCSLFSGSSQAQPGRALGAGAGADAGAIPLCHCERSAAIHDCALSKMDRPTPFALQNRGFKSETEYGPDLQSILGLCRGRSRFPGWRDCGILGRLWRRS